MGSHDQSTVSSDGERPNHRRSGAVPKQLPLSIVASQVPLCSEHEAVTRWMNRQATGDLKLVQGQLLTAECRMFVGLPGLNWQTILARSLKSLVWAFRYRQAPVDHVETGRRSTVSLEAKTD